MKCKKCRRLLALYVGGDLSPGKNRRLENHLSGCSECRRELSLFQTSREAIKKIGKTNIPELKWEEFWSPIRQQVRQHRSGFLHRGRCQAVKSKFIPKFAMPGPALVAILLAIMGLYVFTDFRHFSQPEVTGLHRSVVSSPLAKEKAEKSEISVWLGNKYPIIDYVGNPDANVIVFKTKDPMIKIVWIFDDAFDLTLAK